MILLVQDVKVAFFAEGADAEDAKAAGADVVGGLELIEEILSNELIQFTPPSFVDSLLTSN